jgi:SSS family solute:Na+ symporter
MKLLIPFVIVVPGIIAFNLYSNEMRIEASSDKASVLAKYLRANPRTQFVQQAVSPGDAQIAAQAGGRFLLAIYPDAKSANAVRNRSALVLPMTQAAFDKATAAEYSVFETEDHSWKAVNPEIAAEIEAYNKQTTAAAQAAGKPTSVEKLIAFKYDTALAQLLGNVLPQGSGLVGFVFAALLGAVVSSLAAMLNAASTIFAMDIFQKHLAPKATQRSVVTVGRISVVFFAAVAVLLAPTLGNPKISNSIFTIIQEGQGFISSGILAAFAFGLIVRRAPRAAGIASLLTNFISYGLLKLLVPQLQFLNRMAVCFALCVLVMGVMTALKPLAQPFEFKAQTGIALAPSPGAKLAGIGVIVVTLIFYVIFSPLGVAK